MNSDKLIEALGWATGEKQATPEQLLEAKALYWEARVWQDKEREAEELYAKHMEAELAIRAQQTF